MTEHDRELSVPERLPSNAKEGYRPIIRTYALLTNHLSFQTLSVTANSAIKRVCALVIAGSFLLWIRLSSYSTTLRASLGWLSLGQYGHLNLAPLDSLSSDSCAMT